MTVYLSYSNTDNDCFLSTKHFLFNISNYTYIKHHDNDNDNENNNKEGLLLTIGMCAVAGRVCELLLFKPGCDAEILKNYRPVSN